MYFDKPGKDNTAKTLELAFARGKELGLDEVVLATSKGDTAYMALEIFAGFSLTAVTYHCGWKEPFKPVMDPGIRADLEQKGVRVVSASHALSGLERSFFNKFSGTYPVLVVADTLRLFGQGTKVAVEVVVGAVQAGLVQEGERVIGVGGSSRGADTALVITASWDFADLYVSEVICKPA